MIRKKVDVAVIGAGPAGMAAATSAKKNGAEKVVLFERNPFLGGILLQCIHDGFGLHHYDETLTGPEYAEMIEEDMRSTGVECLLNSMIIDLSPDGELTAVTTKGLMKVDAKAVVLSMGCRERTRGALEIPGARPAGIFTAGVAQNLMNLKNLKLGNKVVILGSGDVGMIMARHVAIEEGMEPVCVIEKMPYVGGLIRNRVQCLEDFNIPLKLSSTITDISGKYRLESVTMSKVDEQGKPVKGTQREIKCDTLLLSVGLIPENEISKAAGVTLDKLTGGALVDDNFETNVRGIFSCGNVLHIHDVADYAFFEGRYVGKKAARFADLPWEREDKYAIEAGDGIQYVVPQFIKESCRKTEIKFRVEEPRQNVEITIKDGNEILYKEEMIKILPSEMQIVSIEADAPMKNLKVALNKV